jgi:hypothetical protein
MEFLGVDGESNQGSSPTIWRDGDDYIIQGWLITDPAQLAEIGSIPANEGVVRIPKRMVQYFPEVHGGGSSA